MHILSAGKVLAEVHPRQHSIGHAGRTGPNASPSDEVFYCYTCCSIYVFAQLDGHLKQKHAIATSARQRVIEHCRALPLPLAVRDRVVSYRQPVPVPENSSRPVSFLSIFDGFAVATSTVPAQTLGTQPTGRRFRSTLTRRTGSSGQLARRVYGQLSCRPGIAATAPSTGRSHLLLLLLRL